MSCTVVIPTLGGATLEKTIACLNVGTVVPAEILVCIPEEYEFRVNSLSIPNVKIIGTPFRGQVKQRIEGFKHSSSEYVMQLDDDLLVDNTCIESLLYSMCKLGSGVAVAPSLLDSSTGNSVYKKPDKNKFVLKIYHWLMNGSKGYQPGTVDRSGSSIGVDPDANDQRWIDVEWLAGGCVMHHKGNLLFENYWPLEGKAYYEDVVHSHELKANGIKLIIDSSARCELEAFYNSSFSFIDYIKNMISDFKGRKYYMNRTSRESRRIYLYYIISVTSYMYKKPLSFINKIIKA